MPDSKKGCTGLQTEDVRIPLEVPCNFGPSETGEVRVDVPH